MKHLTMVAIFAMVVVLASAQKYTDKFDNIDVDRVLSNDRILNNYLKCLLDKGPCTQEGRELKSKYRGWWVDWIGRDFKLNLILKQIER